MDNKISSISSLNHLDGISESIFSIFQLYKLAMRSTLKANEVGLNAMHVRCLPFISQSNHCTANDIVQFFTRDKAQIARLIKEMIDNQWLTKNANPEDKRSQILSLTTQGQELVTLILKTQSDVDKKMQENLTNEELQVFKKTAQKIATNLRSF